MGYSKIGESALCLRCALKTFSAFGLLETRVFFIHPERIYLIITMIPDYPEGRTMNNYLGD